MNERIKIGVSACLLGNKVRYDGGHKLDRFLTDTFGKFVEYVPVCPEAECGLPIPREPMNLYGAMENPKMITVKTRIDLTGKMRSWCNKRLIEIASENLSAYILKSKSPSCAMTGLKIYDEEGGAAGRGSGIWAKMLMDRFPVLPVIDEALIHDLDQREMFVERIFVFQRWRDLISSKPGIGKLVDFHAAHKYLILSHSPDIYRKLGRIAATAKGKPFKDVQVEYFELLQKAMSLKATIKKNVNVLQHLIGYFKKRISAEEKQAFQNIIEQYTHGRVPLIVPLTIINHYVVKYGESYLAGQHYLNPQAIELKLRCHA